MEHTTRTGAIRRRAILAASAAVIAGVATTELAQPVAAATTNGTNFVATNDGTADSGFRTQGSFRVGVSGVGTEQGVFGSSGSGTGVIAFSTSGDAVIGTTFGSGVSGKTGVTGKASGTGNIGVQGTSIDGVGVQGNSAISTGVRGVSDAFIGVIGVGNNTTGVGVYGNSTAGTGAQGQSVTGYGLAGVTAATDGHTGLIGFSSTTSPGGIGLRGSVQPGTKNSFGGVFDGNVQVNGSLFVTGTKAAAVAHPDGSLRVLHCVESPEAWFEDFGEGKLVGGRAEVKLDADFAAIVDASKMHVFLTSHSEDHLHVPQRGANGFSVVASATGEAAARGRKGSEAGGTFSYRIVARRKDVKEGRLAKLIPAPALKAPTVIKLDPITPPAPLHPDSK